MGSAWLVHLQLPLDLFWDLTPREIQACYEAWRKKQQFENERAGTIAAAVHNSFRGGKPVDWTHFFKPLSHRLVLIATAAEIGAKLDMFAAAAEYTRTHGKSRRPTR